ncbi:TPA: DUF4435 domain-containing protein [Escherichia coli]|nr:DUF4435 domain-containing protein [Escherichia coli]
MSDFERKMKSRAYLQAYTRQQSGNQPEARGIMYVENPADRLFWEEVVSQVWPKSYSVKTFALSGKRELEKEYDKLNSSYIVAVDSDFDFLCPERHENACKMNSNPYILHTFCYSRENYSCCVSSVAAVCQGLCYHTQSDHELVGALTKYSEIIFPALAVFSFLHNQDLCKFKEDDFLAAIAIKPAEGERLLTEELKINNDVMSRLEQSVRTYVDRLCSEEDVDLNKCCKLLIDRQITPSGSYLFINGHYLQDKVIMPVLRMIKRKNRKNDINHIKTNCLGKQQRDKINEINNHFDKRCDLDTIMVHKTEFYSTVLFWEKVKEKLANLKVCQN